MARPSEYTRLSTNEPGNRATSNVARSADDWSAYRRTSSQTPIMAVSPLSSLMSIPEVNGDSPVSWDIQRMVSGNRGKKAMVLPATCPSCIGSWAGHPWMAALRNQTPSHRSTCWAMLRWVTIPLTARVPRAIVRERA